MSWAADDRQFVSLVGGFAWSDTPRWPHTSRLYALTGGPEDARFEYLPGYPDLIGSPGSMFARRPDYYGFGTLALSGRIYQFLSTFSAPPTEPGYRFVGT